MNPKDSLEQILNLALVKIKEANINILTRLEELKSLFKEALSKKSPYWELNPDSDRLTKLGLVFKAEPGHIDKGKPIYVSLEFENSALTINLEE